MVENQKEFTDIFKQSYYNSPSRVQSTFHETLSSSCFMFIIIPYIDSLQFSDTETVILSQVLLAKELNLESAKKDNYSAPRTQHTHTLFTANT